MSLPSSDPRASDCWAMNWPMDRRMMSDVVPAGGKLLSQLESQADIMRRELIVSS